MLYNKEGRSIVPNTKCQNKMEEGFAVSPKREHSFLRNLREHKEFLRSKCGGLFKLEARARFITGGKHGK